MPRSSQAGADRAVRGALGHREFRWFFLATSVNRLGSMMTPVAYAFAVLHVDNSASALSQVLAAQVLANVACVLFGGVVADRFSRRMVLQSTYLSAAAVLASTAALLLAGQATVPRLMALSALAGAVSAFALPAVQGIVPQLVPRADLQQANSLVSFVRNSAQILGPVIGSVLVAAGGAPWALIIDAVAYLAASALLLPVRLPAAIRPGARTGARSGIVHELREGWTEFRSRTWLWVTVTAFCILNAITSGAVMVLGPLVAKNTPTLGIGGWGLVMAAQAAGALIASLALLKVHLHHPLRTGMGAIALSALFILALGVYPVTAPLAVASFIAGAGTETFGTGWSVVLGERIPPEILSRVSSYDLVGSFLAMPLGMITYGALATKWPTTDVLTISAALFATTALATNLVPTIRSMTRLTDTT